MKISKTALFAAIATLLISFMLFGFFGGLFVYAVGAGMTYLGHTKMNSTYIKETPITEQLIDAAIWPVFAFIFIKFYIAMTRL